MSHKRLLSEIGQNYPICLVAITMSFEDYLKYFKKMPPEQIKMAGITRGGDMSNGSTYILNLKDNSSYRFKNHYDFKGRSKFKGFVLRSVLGQKLGNVSLKFFLECLKDLELMVRETAEDGQVHDSTPIRLITVIPSAMARIAIKSRNLDVIRKYEREGLEQVRIPDPGKKVSVNIGSTPLIA